MIAPLWFQFLEFVWHFAFTVNSMPFKVFAFLNTLTMVVLPQWHYHGRKCVFESHRVLFCCAVLPWRGSWEPSVGPLLKQDYIKSKWFGRNILILTEFRGVFLYFEFKVLCKNWSVIEKFTLKVSNSFTEKGWLWTTKLSYDAKIMSDWSKSVQISALWNPHHKIDFQSTQDLFYFSHFLLK